MKPPAVWFFLSILGIFSARADVLADLTAKAGGGDALALRQLVHMYATGEGVGKDPAAARKWLEMLAEQGDVAAEIELARACLAAKDPAAAVKWFERAALQGNDDARMELGGLYASGRGVKRDPAAAAKWFSLSASAGNPAAQLQLARMRMTGAGGPKDDIEAMKWAALAAAGGETAGKNIIAALLPRLKPAQIAEARERAAAFVPDAEMEPEIPLPPPDDPVEGLEPVLPVKPE
jgi:TPR repeat protein